VIPGVGSTFHHGESSVIEFIVVNIKEDEFRPEMSLFGSAKNLGNVWKSERCVSDGANFPVTWRSEN
jgi:hypothetical protein